VGNLPGRYPHGPNQDEALIVEVESPVHPKKQENEGDQKYESTGEGGSVKPTDAIWGGERQGGNWVVSCKSICRFRSAP